MACALLARHEAGNARRRDERVLGRLACAVVKLDCSPRSVSRQTASSVTPRVWQGRHRALAETPMASRRASSAASPAELATSKRHRPSRPQVLRDRDAPGAFIVAVAVLACGAGDFHQPENSVAYLRHAARSVTSNPGQPNAVTPIWHVSALSGGR